MSRTVLAKKNQGHITSIIIKDASKKEEIKSLCVEQNYEIQATGKPEDYTVRDGWLEYNVNDMVLIIS